MPDTRVTFQDPQVESAVRDALSIPEGPIQQSHLDGLEALDLGRRPIRDVSDVALCPALRLLILEDTHVSDLRPISALCELETLSINLTPIEDLRPLSCVPTLRRLFVGKTHVSDIAPLVDLLELRELSLSYSPVSDIEPLVTLKTRGGLRKGRVWLWGTPLSITSRLAHVAILRALDVEVFD